MYFINFDTVIHNQTELKELIFDLITYGVPENNPYETERNHDPYLMGALTHFSKLDYTRAMEIFSFYSSKDYCKFVEEMEADDIDPEDSIDRVKDLDQAIKEYSDLNTDYYKLERMRYTIVSELSYGEVDAIDDIQIYEQYIYPLFVNIVEEKSFDRIGDISTKMSFVVSIANKSYKRILKEMKDHWDKEHLPKLNRLIEMSKEIERRKQMELEND